MTAQTLIIEEQEGASPIRIVCGGGAMISREGVAYESKLGGSKHLPIGSDVATQAATSLDLGETEMKLFLEVPWIGRDDVLASGAATPTTPEEAGDLFRKLQGRARRCQVTLGAFVRVGLLRGVKLEPTRGYGINFLGKVVPPGMNVELTLSWEWGATGERTPVAATLGGADLAGGLAGFSAKLPTLLNPEAWVANFADKIADSISSVLTGVEQLKSLCRRVNNLATAPARIVGAIAAAARSVAKSLTEFDDLLSRTPGEALGRSGGHAAAQVAAVSTGRVRSSVGDGMDAVVAIFDALAQRRTREVGVRPGESLALVAKRELGSADRWPAIASLNEIKGQIVPVATFVVEVPSG